MTARLEVAQLYSTLKLGGIREFQSALQTAKNNVFNLKTAIASLAAVAGIKAIAADFLASAVQVENYQTSLNAVIKDAKESRKVFEDLNRWAAINPIDTTDAIAAFVRLKTAAIDNTKEAVMAAADLATVMQTSVADVAGSIVTAETETLRRLGIILTRTGREAIIQSGNVRVAVSNDIESIRKGIIDVIQKNFSGAMQSAGNTWRGMINTMSGMYTMLKQDIMGSAGSGGPFDALKIAIREVKEAWEAWMESDSYKAFVKSAQDAFYEVADHALAAMQMAVRGLESVTQFVKNFPEASQYGILGRVLFGPKGAIFGALSGLFIDMAKAIPSTKLTSYWGLSTEEMEAIRTGALFTPPRIEAPGEGTSFAQPVNDAIDLLRQKIKDAKGQVVELAGAIAGTGVGGASVAGAAEKAKKKFSEMAEELAKSLSISKEEAESRIKSAQKIGELTAAEVSRQKERNDLLMESKLISEDVLASFAQKEANAALEAMKMQYEAGRISLERYLSGMAALIEKFREYPEVAESVKVAMDGVRNSIENTRKTLLTMVTEAQTALRDKLVEIPESLSDAFAGAIAYGNSLSDSLKRLAQDIAYATLKAMLLKQVFSWLGLGGFTSVVSGAGGVVGNAIGNSLSAPVVAAPQTPSSSIAERAESTVINASINISAVDAQSVQRMFEKQSGTIEKIVVSSIMRNGAVRKALQGAI